MGAFAASLGMPLTGLRDAMAKSTYYPHSASWVKDICSMVPGRVIVEAIRDSSDTLFNTLEHSILAPKTYGQLNAFIKENFTK